MREKKNFIVAENFPYCAIGNFFYEARLKLIRGENYFSMHSDLFMKFLMAFCRNSFDISKILNSSDIFTNLKVNCMGII